MSSRRVVPALNRGALSARVLRFGGVTAIALSGLALAGCGGKSHPAAAGSTTATTTKAAAQTAPAAATTNAKAPATTTAAGGGTTTTAPLPVHVDLAAKRAYEAKMKVLGGNLSAAVRSMYPLTDNGVGSKENADAVKKVENARATVTKVDVALQALAPPPDIRADHEKLVDAVGKLGTELDALIHVLEHGGPRPLGSYTEFAALTQIARATDDMTNKGYVINN
jgi:hypothetical protein